MGRTTLTFTDNSNEDSTVTYHAPNLTAANFDAQGTLAGALSVATNALSLGHLSKRTIAQDPINDPGIATDVYAQRELKWRVTYQGDTSGKTFQLEIPCALLTDNLVPNTDMADLTSTSWENWVEAFEAYARTPDDVAETVTVISAKLVGRNL